MKTLILRTMILYYIIVVFPGCKKDFSSDLNSHPKFSNQPPGNFELTIDQISSDKATVNWQQPKDPDGDTVNYQLYLDDSLLLSNYHNSRYTIENLVPLNTYKVKVFASDPKGGRSSAASKFTTIQNVEDSVLFYDSFEKDESVWNTDGELNIGNGSSTITSQLARTGNNSLKMTASHGLNIVGRSDNFRYRAFNKYNEVIVTMYLYFPERIDLYKYPQAPNAFINLFQWKGVSIDQSINDPLWVFGLGVVGGEGSGGANYLKMQYHGQQWPELGKSFTRFTPLVANHPIPTKKWVKFQVMYYKHPSEGRIKVWQDDVLIYDESGLITDPSEKSPTATKLQFSVNNYAESTRPAEYSIYLDDFSESIPGDAN